MAATGRSLVLHALRPLAIFAIYQAAWFACVLGAARGNPLAGVFAVVAALAVLLAWSRRRNADLRLVGLSVAVGAIWDTLFAASGMVVYASPGPLPVFAPPWILAMWALFAPLLREPLRWLHGRPALAAALGGIGGPLSYEAAARLGACSFADTAFALAIIAAEWALVTPLLLSAAQRLDRQ